MTLQEQTKTRRKELGLSQVRLTNAARVSRFRFTLWEAGDGELKPEELVRIDEALQRLAKARLMRLSTLSRSA
jgi:predicted transcriptional regulator